MVRDRARAIELEAIAIAASYMLHVREDEDDHNPLDQQYPTSLDCMVGHRPSRSQNNYKIIKDSRQEFSRKCVGTLRSVSSVALRDTSLGII